MTRKRPTLDWPKVCPKCGLEYSERDWNALPVLAVWKTDSWVTELKNCPKPCKSTLGVEWKV